MPPCYGMSWMDHLKCLECGYSKSCQFEDARLSLEQTLLSTIKDYDGGENMAIDWQHEAESLKTNNGQEDKPWFNPQPGSHKIKIVEEGNEFNTEFEGTKFVKIRLGIEVNGKQYNWSLTKGRLDSDGKLIRTTENSLFGQIALIGKDKGTLQGQIINLIVKGSGKQRDYTIQEALSLMNKKEIAVETIS